MVYSVVMRLAFGCYVKEGTGGAVREGRRKMDERWGRRRRCRWCVGSVEVVQGKGHDKGRELAVDVVAVMGVRS